MSKVRRSRAARLGHEGRAHHAPGGPREHAGRGALGRLLERGHPARGLHHERLGQAGLLGPLGQRGEVGAQAGREVGVGHRRGEALVLAQLGQHLAGERHGHVGQLLAQALAHLRSCSGWRNANRRQTATPSTSATLSASTASSRRAGVERLELALGAHALAHREAQVARDQRGRAGRREVVQRGPGLPADLQQVAEAVGGHERGTSAAPLEQGVRGHGHAVGEGLDVGGLEPRGPHAREHALDWSRGVEGTLAVTSRPSTGATRSVKVPPTSTPSRARASLTPAAYGRRRIFRASRRSKAA